MRVIGYRIEAQYPPGRAARVLVGGVVCPGEGVPGAYRGVVGV